MNVKIGNIWYFFFIILTAGITVGLYFLLKKRSLKTKKIVLFSILMFNLVLHFLKAFIPPYSLDPNRAARDLWFINICAVSVASFPFIFICKSKTAKDFMFYLGLISGFLALAYPTEALGNVYVLDTLRFYLCHMIIFIVPLLMILLKVHTLDYRRIWRIPFCMMLVFLGIICNQVLQSELGFVGLRGDDMLGIGYKNSSLIWGPGSEADGLAKIFSWLTPKFMTKVPFGAYAGQTKYWPFFWILPATFFYFWIIPFFLCLPWEFKHFKNDIVWLWKKISKKKVIVVETQQLDMETANGSIEEDKKENKKEKTTKKTIVSPKKKEKKATRTKVKKEKAKAPEEMKEEKEIAVSASKENIKNIEKTTEVALREKMKRSK